MRGPVTVALAGGAFLVAAGCAPIDEETAAYGGSHRLGLALPSHVAARSETNAAFPLVGELGFTSAPGFEVEYALPLARNFDLRFAVTTNTWDVNFDGTALAGEDATWKATSALVLLTGGHRWGRFGLHFSSGIGMLFNDLHADNFDTAVDDSLALQSGFGITVTLADSVEIGLETGVRLSRTSFVWEGFGGREQVLDGGYGELGLHILF